MDSITIWICGCRNDLCFVAAAVEDQVKKSQTAANEEKEGSE